MGVTNSARSSQPELIESRGYVIAWSIEKAYKRIFLQTFIEFCYYNCIPS